jgi:hypothetical protein
MPHSDPQQLKEYQNRYKKEYNKRPEVKVKREEQRKNRALRNKNFIMESIQPCVVCGEDEPVVIDFHHLDESQKEYGVSFLVQQSYSLDRIKKEIDKCVCLCSNCHRKVHAGIINLRN